MTTRADVMTQALRRMGAQVGLALSGTKTEAILGGLVNTHSEDDSLFQADRLLWLTAAAEADKETSIDIWTDQLGRAQFKTRTNAVVADDPYVLVPLEDYTLKEIRQALDDAQSYARRSYRQVIPITPNLDLYPLTQLDWLQGAGSIDAVWINQSPTWLHNEDFALWHYGASGVPDGYTLFANDPVLISRVDGGTRSPYRCQIDTTAMDSGTALLVQEIPQSLTQWLTRRVAPVFTPLRAAAWVESYTPGNRIFIRYTETETGSPVATYAYSAEIPADGNPSFVDLSLTPTATMNDFTWGIEVVNNSVVAISAAVFLQSTTAAPELFAIRDQGSQAYQEVELYNAIRNVGGVPTIELTAPIWTPMQLIVYSRRPYPDQTADDDIIEDRDARVLEYGLLNFLLRAVKPNQDRSRLDYILYGDRSPRNDGASGAWTRYLSNLTDRPVQRPPIQVIVGGNY